MHGAPGYLEIGLRVPWGVSQMFSVRCENVIYKISPEISNRTPQYEEHSDLLWAF